MAEQQKPVIVEDEDKQQETFSVQEKIDAGELVNPAQEGTVEDLPTEGGVPRLDITPIRVKPRPEAGVGVTDGQIQLRPEVKFKTLKDAAEKSLEEQQKPGTTYEDVISRLEKGETVKAGSLTLYPNEVEVVKTNKKMNTAVREAVAIDSFYKEKEASGKAPEEPGIAFTDPQRKEAIPLDDSLLNDASQDYAESRIRLNDHIKNKKLVDTGDSQVDVAVRQVFIDQFSTGSFFESLSQRLAEGGRGAVVLPGFAVEMTGSFAEAVRNKLKKGTPFLDEWASLESKRQERSKAYLEEIDRFLPAPTMAMAFNQDIRARFDKELEEGTITKEQHERLVFKRGISGDLIEREFVTEQQAYDLVEFAFTEMPELAQAGVIATDFLLTGTSIAALQARGAKGVVQEVRKLRQEFNIPASVRLSSIPAWVQAADTKRKINTSLFEIGLQNQRLKTQTKFAKRRAAALEKEIPALEKQAQDALEAKDLPKRKELIKELETKKSEAVNLRRKAFRNAISANVSPYVTSVAKDDLFLAGAAFAGSELLTGSMDRDMGEVSGLLAGLIFKKPATFVAKKAGKGAAGLVYTTGMRSMMPAVMQKMLRMDTTVDDFFRISGQESTYASRKAVHRVFKEIERMPPAERAEFKKAIQKHVDLENEIINGFPVNQREEARELFRSSFAELTGQAPLIGMYRQSVGAITSKSLRKMGFGGLQSQLSAINAQSRRAMEAINNFEQHVMTYANPNSKAKMRELVQTAKNSVANVEAMVQLEYSSLDNQINLMVKSVTSDAGLQLNENFMTDAIRVQKLIRESLSIPQAGGAPTVGEQRAAELGQVSKKMERVSRLQAAALDGLSVRLDQVKGMRDDKIAHQQATATAAEAVLNTRYSALAEMGDEAYDSFRSFVANRPENPGIDIAPFVSDMLRISEEKDILKFFGPQATYFSGHLGKRAMKMFEGMVQRRLSEFGEDGLSEIMEQMKLSLQAQGKSETDIQQVIDYANNLYEENPVKFGLFLHEAGSLNVFARANIEEAEELRRAFRDYGYKVNNPSVSLQFEDAQTTIDDAMKASDPEGYEVLATVREMYSSSKDPTRPGTILQKLQTSRQAEKVDLDSGPFSGLYRNEDPYTLLSKTGEKIATVLSGSTSPELIASTKHRIGQDIAQLEQLFGDHIGANGELYIDLDTEDGRKALDVIRQLTEEVVYASWANNITKQLPAPGTRSGKLPQAFSMDTYDNFDQLTAEKLQINVTGGGAGERTESLIDLTAMIVEERKIDKVVARGQKYHEQGKLAKNEFDVLVDRIGNETKIAQRRETQALSNIRALTGITSNRDFYDRFIAGNDDIDTVKELFITQFAKDPALEGADLDELFKEATYKMAYGALKEIGGQRSTRIMGSSEAKSLINQLQGDDVGLVTEYTNALGMIEALNDPDIVKNLGKIGIDKKHTDHLSNIMEYVASKQAVAIASDASARGMNPNEVLSRAYNIAREMVSPTYIASELAIRIIQKNNSDTFLLALQSKEAAQIMEKMMYFPEKIRPQDMQTFEALLVQFAAVETIKKGQEPAIEAWYGEILGEDDEQE